MNRSLFLVLLLIVGTAPIAWAQSRLIAHVPRADGGFAATLALQNDSPLTKTVSFTAYNQLGEALGSPLSFTVDGVSVRHLDTEETLPADTAYIEVGGSERVRVSLLYRTANVPESARAVVDESRNLGRRFHLLPTSGETTAYWEGFALVNPNGQTANVTMDLYRGPGQPIANAEMILQPGHKMLALFGDIFTDQAIETGDFIRLRADQNVAVVVLHGNLETADLTNVTPEPFYAASASVETGDTQNIPRDPFEILEASLEEEFLKLRLRFPSGCTDISLVWSGAFKESFPVQADLHLRHDVSAQFCTEVITETDVDFDLAPLAMSYMDGGGSLSDAIILNIISADGNGVFTTLTLRDDSAPADE